MPTARRYFDRKDLAAELRRLGFIMGDSTLVKLCMRGEGPPVAARDGRRWLYRLPPAIRWAERRLRKPVTPDSDTPAPASEHGEAA